MNYEAWLIELKRQREEEVARAEFLRRENEVDKNLIDNINLLMDDLFDKAKSVGLIIKNEHNLIKFYTDLNRLPILIIRAKYKLLEEKRSVLFVLEKHRTKELTEKYVGHSVSKTWLEGFLKFYDDLIKERKRDYENTYQIKPDVIPEIMYSAIPSCKLCGGAGGAIGNCPNCGKSGVVK